MADSQAQQLAECSVLDLEGRAHALGEHFTSRPAAVLFIRHFG